MVTTAFYDPMTKRTGSSCGNWGVSGQLYLGIPIKHLRGGGQALERAEKEVQELPQPLQSFSEQQRQNILFLTVMKIL